MIISALTREVIRDVIRIFQEEDDTFLLDDFPGAFSAYSVRQLRTGVTNVIRVRRTNDQAEQDFTAAEVADGTLETFVGAGNDGFIVTWYDQSGGTIRNLTQSTASQQARIVQSGVLNVVGTNNRPGAVFSDAAATSYSDNFASQAQPNTFFWAGQRNTTTSDNMLMIGPGTNLTNRNQFVYLASSTAGSMFAGTVLNTSAAFTNNVLDQVTTLFNGGSSVFRHNSTQIANGNAGTQASTGISLGARPTDNANALDGTISEAIMYPSDQTTNFAGIESNQKTYFGIA